MTVGLVCLPPGQWGQLLAEVGEHLRKLAAVAVRSAAVLVDPAPVLPVTSRTCQVRPTVFDLG